ncbi:MAG: hypothetical protein H0W46_04445 [Acidimicrobiia bacterium]|nr:hypothetical protein [Acidimicrobiia bacterium]
MTLAVSGVAPYAADTYKTPAKFIPDVWSGKMQVKFYAATCLSEVTNNDWEGEIKDVGDAVIIRSIASITISNYTKGLVLTSQVPTSTPITLNIDQGKYFQVVLDDVDATQSDLKLMNSFTDDAGEQMKIVIETAVFLGVKAQAHASNRGNTAGVASANIRLGATTGVLPAYVSKAAVGTGDGTSTAAKAVVDHLVDMGQVLDEQNAPEQGRWMLIPPVVANRIKKSDLKQVNFTGDDVSPIRNGKLGMIDRFTLYVTNNLPRTGSELTIFAGTRDAISFASQLTKVETLRSTATFGDIVRGLNVYGFLVTKPEALVESIIVVV